MSGLLMLLQGFGYSLIIFSATLIVSLPLGLAVCLGTTSKIRPLKWIMRAFVSVIRGTPLMLQLILLCYGPPILIQSFSWREIFPSLPTSAVRLIISVITFSINYAAYFSEIFRGGLLSVPAGQYEAGAVLGMTKRSVFKNVILLQVIKRVVPPVSNEIITLIKDTSLAQVIAVTELTMIADRLRTTLGGVLWPLLSAGAIYFVFNAVVTLILGAVEKKLNYIRI